VVRGERNPTTPVTMETVSKEIEKVLPRSLESADHIWVVRGKGTFLEYASGAGKIGKK